MTSEGCVDDFGKAVKRLLKSLSQVDIRLSCEVVSAWLDADIEVSEIVIFTVCCIGATSVQGKEFHHNTADIDGPVSTNFWECPFGMSSILLE